MGGLCEHSPALGHDPLTYNSNYSELLALLRAATWALKLAHQRAGREGPIRRALVLVTGSDTCLGWLVNYKQGLQGNPCHGPLPEDTTTRAIVLLWGLLSEYAHLWGDVVLSNKRIALGACDAHPSSWIPHRYAKHAGVAGNVCIHLPDVLHRFFPTTMNFEKDGHGFRFLQICRTGGPGGAI